jgi:hypothetical protein
MLWGDGFEVETLINVRIAMAGLKVSEVASFEERRIHGVSNLNAVSDGVRVLRTIARERRRHVNRRRPGLPDPATSRRPAAGPPHRDGKCPRRTA